jgi:hypothetical protein
MKLGLQPLEPETVRVAAVGDPNSPAGAACLVSSTHLLTCHHVVDAALDRTAEIGDRVPVTLVGVTQQVTLHATVAALAGREHNADFARDIALLTLDAQDSSRLAIRPVEFATPLVHSGKPFGVMGFPKNRPFGLHASGQLQAPDRNGLVQMDGNRTIAIAPGFSGAPVWCQDLRAFVGIVVAGEDKRGLAWCIPSRILCGFFPELLVKFRMPPVDRPVINDKDVDDPNPVLFGDVSDNGIRRLTAWVMPARRQRKKFEVHVRYGCIGTAAPPRGGYVTFITYPNFKWEEEDAYELFALIKDGAAEQHFFPVDGFTVAAIGDAGDTALTLDLCGLPGKLFPCS